MKSSILLFYPAGDGPDCCRAAFISFCKHSGRHSVGTCCNNSHSFFRTQRFVAERGGLLHDVRNLRTFDDMKYQGAVWFNNYFGIRICHSERSSWEGYPVGSQDGISSGEMGYLLWRLIIDRQSSSTWG